MRKFLACVCLLALAATAGFSVVGILLVILSIPATVVVLHRQDRCHPVDDIVRFLEALLGDGGVRLFGFGDVLDRADHFADLADPSLRQIVL